MKVNFAGFDGLERTCVRFKKAKGNVYRCADYAPASKVGKHPKACAPGLVSRSVGLIRADECRRAARKPKKASHKRRSRRSRR